jgi:tetrahydromethanopterin S-methyltransferase subunit A
MKKKEWLKPIKRAKKLKKIEAQQWSWKQDPKGFFLIKMNRKDKKIHVGYCTNRNVLKYEIAGKRAQDIYYTIAKMGLVTLFEHAAYLGKELKKAELAIKYRLKYVQDEDIDFKNKK